MSYFENLDSSKRELIEKHLELVIKANKRINLTRIEDIDQAKVLHIEDSLTGIPEITSAPVGKYADIGSGAGYPGIPLAIATGRETLLIDARMKKMQAVQEMIIEMDLADRIKVYSGRAELLARTQGDQFAVVTARALSKLSVLLELAYPLLQNGGHLICYKSIVDDQEMEESTHVQKLVGMKLISDRSLTLSNGHSRRIITYIKSEKSKIKLPRQEGMAQKNPLK